MDSSTPFVQSGLSSLRQPATVAVVVSIGIHALLAANIEKIRLFPSSAQLPPSVELVELSPDQVQSIYPKAQPKITLTPIAPPSSLSAIWGGGPTIPEFPGTVPPPPEDSFIFSPRPGNLPSISTSPSSGLPPIPSRPPSISSFPPVTPIQPGSLSIDIPQSLTLPSSELPPAPTDLPLDKNTREFNRMRGRAGLKPLTPEQQAIVDGLTDDVYLGFGGPGTGNQTTPDETGMNNNPGTPGEPEPESPPPSPSPNGSLLARLEQDNQERDERMGITPDETESPVGTVSEREMLMATGGSAYVNWVVGLQSNDPSIEPAQPMLVTGVYPAQACEQQLEGEYEALVGVVVSPNGEILQGPEVLLSSEYPVLDNEAVQKVREFVVNQAPQSDSPKAYSYAFEFDSEICRSVTSPSGIPPTTSESETSPNNSIPPVEPDIEGENLPPAVESEVMPPDGMLDEVEPDIEGENLPPAVESEVMPPDGMLDEVEPDIEGENLPPAAESEQMPPDEVPPEVESPVEEENLPPAAESEEFRDNPTPPQTESEPLPPQGRLEEVEPVEPNNSIEPRPFRGTLLEKLDPSQAEPPVENYNSVQP